MKRVQDLMNSEPPAVTPGLSVTELARMLLESGRDGYCVLEHGELVGVVTAMDLVFQNKQVHLPTFITLLDTVIPLGNRRAHDELEKITGTTVAAVMSQPPITVTPDTTMQEAATLMVERHLSLLPVVNARGVLVGELSKPALLTAVLRREV